MKKFYLAVIIAIAFMGFSSILSAQTYTAVQTGNASDPLTWDINGLPSNPCTNCTITVSSGITMTLDVNFELKGTSMVFVSPNAKVLITNSNGTSLATGHNAVLDTLPGSFIRER